MLRYLCVNNISRLMNQLRVLWCLLLWLGGMMLLAQPTSLGGTLSLDASAVTAIDPANASVTVANAAPFASGDRVLLIQMQGASISTANDSSFGNLSAFNGAGNYELNVVCDVRPGNEIVLENTLAGTYASSGVGSAGLQLIEVPQYDDVNINNTLTAPAWNGSTGGVLIFEAAGTVTLNADIDMSGQGFRGGAYLDMDVDEPGVICSNFFPFANTRFMAYHYTLADQDGADKGEGIAPKAVGQEYGRGHQSNGGGGGNEHDAGGGGGANYGVGGIGGERLAGSCNGEFPGIGGLSLAGAGYLSANQGIFMGGGGGAGHSNNEINDPDYPGGDGGGIVILVADQVVGNGHTIRANGEGFSVMGGAAFNDGGSGGGGGGTVILHVNGLTGALTAEARGGKGTDVNSASPSGSGCSGAGGGGGGGVVWTNVALAGLTTDVVGGPAGFDNNGACGTATSAPGSTGAALTGYTLPTSTTTNAACVLPVELLRFTAELRGEAVALRWVSLAEVNHAYYQVERHEAARGWVALGQVAGQGEQRQGAAYRFQDLLPQPGDNQYRLAMYSLDGRVSYSAQVVVAYQPGRALRLLQVWTTDGQPHARIHLPLAQPWQFVLKDVQGRVIQQQWESADQPGPQLVPLQAQPLTPGVYLLSVQQAGQRVVQRLMVH